MQLFRTICTVELECILNGGGLRSPIAPGVPSQLLFTMVKLFWYCVVFLLLPASVCVVPYISDFDTFQAAAFRERKPLPRQL